MLETPPPQQPLQPQPASKRAKLRSTAAARTPPRADASRKALLAQKSELEARRNKLRLVRTYRSSNDVADLGSVTEKWRSAAAEALEALAAAHPDATVPKLLQFYGIEADLLGYNAEDECFE